MGDEQLFRPRRPLVRHYGHESFAAGYVRREFLVAGSYTELVLCGRTLAVDAESLRRLAGKRLVVEMITAADAAAPVLRTV